MKKVFSLYNFCRHRCLRIGIPNLPMQSSDGKYVGNVWAVADMGTICVITCGIKWTIIINELSALYGSRMYGISLIWHLVLQGLWLQPRWRLLLPIGANGCAAFAIPIVFNLENWICSLKIEKYFLKKNKQIESQLKNIWTMKELSTSNMISTYEHTNMPIKKTCKCYHST